MIPAPAPEVPTCTVTEAAKRHQTGARIIDVREPVEHNSLRVPGADLLPMSTIQSWYTDLDVNEELLVLCRSGNRSATVVDALVNQAGFTNVTNIAGGIMAWGEAGLPLEH